MTLPPAVLWADPGGMTGLAYFFPYASRPDLRFGAREYAFMDACSAAAAFCELHGRHGAVGWERYRALPGKPQKDAHLALEPIGVLRFFATANGCTILPEAQQHTPNAKDQERLKALGWWVPGADDAQSAAAHMLNWLMRSGNLPPREAQVLAALRGA